MYSRTHCLAMMPNKAAARLSTRLKKKSALIHRADEDGDRDGGSRRGFMVAFMKGGMS